MKLFGWVVEHERSPDGHWDLTTFVTTPSPNTNVKRVVTNQVHYRIRFGFSTVSTGGKARCHQLVVGSHSWTFAKLA